MAAQAAHLVDCVHVGARPQSDHVREYTTLMAQGRGGNELWAAVRPVRFYLDAYLRYR